INGVLSLYSNLWTLANARRFEDESAYTRVVLAPIFVYRMGYCFLRTYADGNTRTWRMKRNWEEGSTVIIWDKIRPN
ncbi:Polyphosphatidylinositol phosphatase INP53, partial [Bienertia sinuspersici]